MPTTLYQFSGLGTHGVSHRSIQSPNLLARGWEFRRVCIEMQEQATYEGVGREHSQVCL